MNPELILYLLENFTVIRHQIPDFETADQILWLDEHAQDQEHTVYVAAKGSPSAHFAKSLIIAFDDIPADSANYILLAGDHPGEVLNTLLKARSHLDRLASKLASAIGNQEVIDAAAQITGNPLFYFDSSYRILAISNQNEFPGDTEWKHMKEKGFLSPESIRLMSESGDLDLLADKVDPFPYRASYYPFPSLVCNIWNEKIFFSRLNMLCVNGIQTELNIQECRIICSALLRIARSSGDIPAYTGPLNSMVLDLLRGHRLSEELIYDRLSSIPGLRNSLIQVCCLDPKSGNDPQVSSYYASLLKSMFADDPVVILEFEDKIVLILHCADQESFRPFHEKLIPLLKSQGLKCAAGNIFRRFSDLRDYYLQALSALSLSREISGLVLFQDVFFDYVLSFIPRSQALSMVSYDITHLLHLQQNYQFPLAQTLKQYLKCGCNLQQTAEKLYIHKNTALYRLNHIRELIQSDLDDPEQQEELLFSFEILERYPMHL